MTDPTFPDDAYSGSSWPRTAEALAEAQAKVAEADAAQGIQFGSGKDISLYRTVEPSITTATALCIITSDDDSQPDPDPIAENEYLFEGRVDDEVVIRLLADGTLETGEGWKGARTGRLLLLQMMGRNIAASPS
jgi:hypothetical protein